MYAKMKVRLFLDKSKAALTGSVKEDRYEDFSG
jgi:hypothetical protein